MRDFLWYSAIVALRPLCSFSVLALRGQPLRLACVPNMHRVTIQCNGDALHPSYVGDNIKGGNRVWNVLLFVFAVYYLMQATGQPSLRAQAARSSATVVTWHLPMLR